jgi:NADPH-dependent 2,4-dienoyl-CoA reductase/sulfur reductase-like enzyme/peroxiredoxin family protein/rhodanese-related sulfurtransferase/TusA-related sulfurtransferase
MTDRKRILIVGGVAGGASAATRARRLSETAEIVVFERTRHISFANCGMPYHIGGVITDRGRLLVTTPDVLRRRYRIDVRTRHEVVRIDRQARTVLVRNLVSGAEIAEPYDNLILSPGAEPLRPPIPGAESSLVFTLRSLDDMDRIKRAIDEQRPARAVVLGGGYIGLEMAEALCNRKVDVTLVELAPQVFVAADPEMVAPVHQQLQRHGVDLRLGTSVAAIREDAGRLRVRLSSGDEVECGMLILAAGVRPESRLAKEAGLAVGPSGGIVVDRHMRTSDPAIYAVGDAVEVVHTVGKHKCVIPLAGPANRQGRVAADNIFGRTSVYTSTQGTAICKVFDLAIGMTGMSEKALRHAGAKYEKVYVHPASHASYYPGASQMSLKLIFDPADGRVLGAQAVGADGVDKRIDVLALAVRAGMTVEDLKDVELCYAPPYGSAKDPVNYAGFVAADVRAGDVHLCHTEDVAALRDDQMLLDVRTPAEVEAGTIPGAVNIPLDDLRERLAEVPKHKEILAFCGVGLRGYIACRILTQNGYNCRNLTGGYKTYRAAVGALARPEPPKPEKEGLKMEVQSDACQTDACEPRPPLPKSDPPHAKIVKEIDACGLQCPGPIMKLKGELDGLADGEAVSIIALDHGFPADVTGWCHSTGNVLASIAPEGKGYRATVVRRVRPAASAAAAAGPLSKDKTVVVFSGDFDKAMAAFIIANGAAAMGSKVTMFFTFWGLNVLRRAAKVPVRKTIVERMFGWMMPRGAERLALSRMHMGGMGLAMIKGIMRKKGVPALSDLIASAQVAGVRLVACSMSMDLMGIRREELIDAVEEGGVAMYLDSAEAGAVNLFI